MHDMSIEMILPIKHQRNTLMPAPFAVQRARTFRRLMCELPTPKNFTCAWLDVRGEVSARGVLLVPRRDQFPIRVLND